MDELDLLSKIIAVVGFANALKELDDYLYESHEFNMSLLSTIEIIDLECDIYKIVATLKKIEFKENEENESN